MNQNSPVWRTKMRKTGRHMLVDALTEWQCGSTLENKPSQTTVNQTNLRAPPPDTLLYPLWENKNKKTLTLMILLLQYMTWVDADTMVNMALTWHGMRVNLLVTKH